jgi:hypothetical protein
MSQTFAQSLTELFQLNSNTILDDALLNRILRALEARLKPLEEQKGSLDTAIEQVRQVGLARINEVLTPAIEGILDVQARGFLIARSSTPATLGNGNVLELTVDDEAERALFTPSPFTALTRAATVDDYAIARTVAYDQATGDYLCEVISFAGDPGPHEDWVIGALAGPTIAMLAMLAEGQAARDESVAAAETAVGAKNTTVEAADTAVAKAALAAEWAEKPEDEEVAAGQFSAKHHALKAAASALAAAMFDPDNFYTKGETFTQAEITAAISAAIDGILDGAPGALNTLNELAAAVNDDASFAAAVTAALALKAPAADPELTGDIYLHGRQRGPATAVAAANLDCSATNYFTKTVAGSTTFTVSNIPAGAFGFALRMTYTSGTVTWPASFKWTAPTLTSGKTYLIICETDDGGTKIRATAIEFDA